MQLNSSYDLVEDRLKEIIPYVVRAMQYNSDWLVWLDEKLGPPILRRTSISGKWSIHNDEINNKWCYARQTGVRFKEAADAVEFKLRFG